MTELKRCNDRIRQAFTIVEMLLSLMVSALIGLGVAMMLSAIGSATRAESDTRHASMNREMVRSRIGSLIRSSAVVLAQSNDVLVLWTDDDTGEGLPNVSELRRIEWKKDTRQVLAFEAGSGLAASDDVTYAMDADFLAITEAFSVTPDFIAMPLASDVDDFAVSLHDPVSESPQTVQVNLTMQDSSGPTALELTATTRVHAPASER